MLVQSRLMTPRRPTSPDRRGPGESPDPRTADRYSTFWCRQVSFSLCCGVTGRECSWRRPGWWSWWSASRWVTGPVRPGRGVVESWIGSSPMSARLIASLAAILVGRLLLSRIGSAAGAAARGWTRSGARSCRWRRSPWWPGC